MLHLQVLPDSNKKQQNIHVSDADFPTFWRFMLRLIYCWLLAESIPALDCIWTCICICMLTLTLSHTHTQINILSRNLDRMALNLPAKTLRKAEARDLLSLNVMSDLLLISSTTNTVQQHLSNPSESPYNHTRHLWVTLDLEEKWINIFTSVVWKLRQRDNVEFYVATDAVILHRPL